MNLICKPLINGIMAYWTPVEDASHYNVKLYINNQLISTRVNERTELYCTFTGLAPIDGVTSSIIQSSARSLQHIAGGGYSRVPQHSGFDYYVEVEAEHRNGQIIEKTEIQKCKVREL